MKNGIDISYAQGEIDWSKVETDFVIIKCNTGINAPDTQLWPNAKGASEKGIPLTYYHWATLKTFDVVTDAKQEAKEFINYLSALPKYHPDLPPILDFEEKNALKFSPEMMQLWILTFYSELRKAKHDMWLYSYAPYLDENLPANHICGHIPLWIAGYPWDKDENVGPNGKALGFANIPEDIGQPRYLPKGWTMDMVAAWQLTGQGRKPDVSEDHVDLVVLF